MTHATVSLRGIAAFLLFFAAFALGQCVAREAHAQTVGIVGTQKALAASSQGVTGVACTAAAATRRAFWYPVSTQRNAMVRVSFTDANASAADLEISCETTNSTGTAAGSGQALPTLYSTTAAFNLISALPWAWTAVGGGAPGTSSFILQIANIPDAFIGCLFTCGAGGAGADVFTATFIGVNP